MVYNRSDLIAETKRGKRYKYIFFWGHTPAADGQIGPSCLSQWWGCRFAVDGVGYSCAEQYMMAEKARMFGDHEMLAKILEAGHPKAIGLWPGGPKLRPGPVGRGLLRYREGGQSGKIFPEPAAVGLP